jgi:hypothetical protein
MLYVSGSQLCALAGKIAGQLEAQGLAPRTVCKRSLIQHFCGKPYAQRQLLLDLDPTVEPYLTELVHRRPNYWEGDVEVMYRLYRAIGRADFLAAVALAVEQHCYGGEYLVTIADEGRAVAGGGLW